ncbi:MAG: hypothetical protein IJP92_06750 [Lachnospiraceae bacterium]|nr:hypothetical protein [Lachnospiraceae bacterium]
MSPRKWLIGFFILIFAGAAFVMAGVYLIDPFFHYHAPRPGLFYPIRLERYQNDGIIRHFPYNAMITGTSLTENFRTSELDALFGTKSIKVPFNGGSYKEINDNVLLALRSNPELRYVVRVLDANRFLQEADYMQEQAADYPVYLYNENPFDDVQYLLNKEVVFYQCLPVLDARKRGEAGGHTSFDTYVNWNANYSFGKDAVLGTGTRYVPPKEIHALSAEEKTMLLENIEQNVIAAAGAYPDKTFFYVVSPYSIAWWGSLWQNGDLEKQLEIEEITIRRMLEADNIRVFSYNTDPDIIANLDNYKDMLHYGEWINSLMLRDMAGAAGLSGETGTVSAGIPAFHEITKENAEDYFRREREFLTGYDYAAITD